MNVEQPPHDRGAEPDDDPRWVPAPLAPDEVEEAVVVDREGQTLGPFREVAASYFRGPLPSPQALREYNNAIPGLGERIVSSWEDESRHRRGLERRIVDAAIANQSRGQLIAAAIALVIAGGGIVLIALGHDIAGLIALIPNLVALVGLFLYGVVRSGPVHDELPAEYPTRPTT